MPAMSRFQFDSGRYFFTARLRDSGSDLLVRYRNCLRQSFQVTTRRNPFRIDAIVILPSAIHTIWALPNGDVDFQTRWRVLQDDFARRLPEANCQEDLRARYSGSKIWSPFVTEHPLLNVEDSLLLCDFIYEAPVRAGLCDHPRGWPHSSIHRDFARSLGVFQHGRTAHAPKRRAALPMSG